MRRVLVADHDQDRAEAVVPGPAVELPEVQALGSHTCSTHNRRPCVSTTATTARPGRYSPWSHPRRDGRGIIPDGGDPAACCLAGGHPAAQSRSVGGDQAAPDTVLADVPVLQG
jgi:hypothetical protein